MAYIVFNVYFQIISNTRLNFKMSQYDSGPLCYLVKIRIKSSYNLINTYKYLDLII